VVAIIQRNKGTEKSSPAIPTVIPFAVPERDWDETRRRALAAESDVKHLAKAFDAHVAEYKNHAETAEEKLSQLRINVGRLEGKVELL